MRGAADSGVSGCAACSYEGGAVICTRCAAGHLGVAGASCSNSCIGNTLGECSDITEQGGSSTTVSCKCICKPGLYNNSGTCAPCTESCAVCRNGDPAGCQQCNPGKVLEPLVVASDSADASLSTPLAANAGVRDNHRRQQVLHALQGLGYVSTQRCVHCRFSAERCVLHQQGKWRLQHVFTGCLSDEWRLLQIRLLPRKRRLQRTVGREVPRGEEGYGMSAAGSCIDPDACVDGCCISGSACLPCAVVGARPAETPASTKSAVESSS